MDQLRSILEEAQTVVGRDDLPYQQLSLHNNYAAFSNFFPTFAEKPVVHKVTKSVKKRTWKKPKDKPKRPLSAYNLFFQHERKKIIAVLPEDKSVIDDGLTEEQRRRKHRKTHGKIGFADLARSIAEKWKNIDDSSRATFEARAEAEKDRYRKELEAWKKTQKDNGEKSKTVKKKTQIPPENDASKPAVQQRVPPDALTAMLATNVNAQRAQMLKLVMGTQASQFQQQVLASNPNLHDVIMASCSGNLFNQKSDFQLPLSNVSAPSFGLNPTPIDPLKLGGSGGPSITDTLRSNQRLQHDNFAKDNFFDDVGVQADDGVGDEAFSETSNPGSNERPNSFEDDMNAFIEDFEI